MKPQSLTYQQIQNDLIENINSNRSDFQFECFNILNLNVTDGISLTRPGIANEQKQKYSV